MGNNGPAFSQHDIQLYRQQKDDNKDIKINKKDKEHDNMP